MDAAVVVDASVWASGLKEKRAERDLSPENESTP
jgi:hypothetical protein